MKLTVELIQQSPQYRNAVNDRELYLRGYKITVIENMAVTKDQFDCIDFCDNDIRKLDGFPIMKRLTTLLLCNNHIVRITDDIHEKLPNLKHLVLTNNNIKDLVDLHSIRKLRKLSHLRNPCTTKKYYRQYLIYMFPQLNVLDFKRIRPTERDEVKKLFSGTSGLRIRKNILLQKFDEQEKPKPGISTSNTNVSRNKDTDKIREAIKNSKTLADIQELEKILQSGAPLPIKQT